MKILMDARMVTGNHGIGRYTLTLIHGLKARGHEISILSSSRLTEKIVGRDLLKDVISCKLRFAHPAETFELAAKVRPSQFDIVHFPSFAVPFKVSSNTIITIHDLIHLHNPSLAHKLYYNTIVAKALNTAGGVITVSEWAKGELHHYLNIHKKINVVRNGLEKKWFEKLKTPENKRLAKPFFLCLSNLKSHKNVKTLLSAAQNLWESHLEFELILSLGGEDLSEKWNVKSDFRKNIKIIKNISDEELRIYFQNCMALISPSYFEGYDYAVGEALAQGKPAILSQGSAHDEFKGGLVHFYGDAGHTQGLIQAMKKILDAPPFTSFDHNVSTQDEMIDGTLAVYESTLKGLSF